MRDYFSPSASKKIFGKAKKQADKKKRGLEEMNFCPFAIKNRAFSLSSD